MHDMSYDSVHRFLSCFGQQCGACTRGAHRLLSSSSEKQGRGRRRDRVIVLGGLTSGGWPVQAPAGEVLVDVVIFVDDSVGAGSTSGPGGGTQPGVGDAAEAAGAGGTKLTSVPLTGAYQPGNFDALPVRLRSVSAVARGV